jgi:hypothetical protein
MLFLGVKKWNITEFWQDRIDFVSQNDSLVGEVRRWMEKKSSKCSLFQTHYNVSFSIQAR